MTVTAFVHKHEDRPVQLPDTPYELWVRGELDDYLHLSEGARVEVVGGEIIVSAMPRSGHAVIIDDVYKTFIAAEFADPTFAWRGLQNVGLNVTVVGDGYIPDLVVMTQDSRARLAHADVPHLHDDEPQLVVEVTSPSTCAEDRKPGPRRQRPSKWNGYAAVGIPFYLMIDRDPKIMASTLYTEPHRAGRSYTAARTWQFGETIELPAPFGISIDTKWWNAWTE